MKNISLITALLLTVSGLAQSYSESIADIVVAGQKTTISTALGVEVGLRKKQRDLWKDLIKLEGEYAGKRTPLSNSSILLVLGAIEYTFSRTKERIGAIEHNMRIFKFASLGMHGLRKLKGALKREKEYLETLNNQLETLRSGLLLSGSAGDNYTVYLKLLIALIPIKNNVQGIDKEIKARMKITRILAK